MVLLAEDDAALVARAALRVTLVGEPVEARDHRELVVANKRLAVRVPDVDEVEVLVPLRQLLARSASARGVMSGLSLAAFLLPLPSAFSIP
jgi:hypothetical protein